ncbi:MAG: glycosyltransferase family A protein [Candidatus Absconditabacterales bacterium]
MDSKNTPLVSVIMPTYNRARTIGNALISVMQQDYPNMEVIVVDDGSTDDTQEVVTSFQKQDDRITLINHVQNQGIAKSRNTGMAKAQGDIFAPLDSDDIWIDGHKIQKQISFLEKHSEISIVGTNGIIKNNKEGYYRSHLPQTNEEIKNKIFRACPFMHSTVLFKREVYDKCGGYPEDIKFCEDYAYWLKAGKDSKFANLPDYTMLYDTNTENTCYTHYIAQMKEALLLFFKYRKEYPDLIGGIKHNLCELLSTYLSKNHPNTRKLIRKMFLKPDALPLDISIDQSIIDQSIINPVSIESDYLS